MVRTSLDDDRAVFERSEADGRSHSPWVLEATVAPTEEGSRLVMHLHYGGALWGPVLERMLGDEIEKSRPRLLACLAPLRLAAQPDQLGVAGGPAAVALLEHEIETEALATTCRR